MQRIAGMMLLMLISMIMLVVAGCSKKMPAGSDLDYYARGLPTMTSVLDKFDLVHFGSGVGQDGVHLEVRKRHDPMRPVTEKEIQSIRKAIYEYYDREFPLRINVWTMPEKPDVTGKITAIGEGTVLVVADDMEDGGNPRAMWLGTGKDSVILDKSTGEPMEAGQLSIGNRVLAWSEPMVMTSYPEQSGLLRLEVTDTGIGPGDLQGVITKKGIGVEDTTRSELQIDGKPYRLMTTTVVNIGGKTAAFEDLKEGDRARVWFTGYEAGSDEKIVTQVVVE